MNTLLRASHGGHCCGINHVYGFGGRWVNNALEFATVADVKQRIKESTGSVVEVVLTRYQLEQQEGHLEKVMTKAGFRLVSTFMNKNSGSQCYVFHYYKKYRRRNNDLPLVLPSVVNAAMLRGELPVV